VFVLACTRKGLRDRKQTLSGHLRSQRELGVAQHGDHRPAPTRLDVNSSSILKNKKSLDAAGSLSHNCTQIIVLRKFAQWTAQERIEEAAATRAEALVTP
jgi:hypothetical protein